jgi:hypothetical protein
MICIHFASFNFLYLRFIGDMTIDEKDLKKNRKKWASKVKKLIASLKSVHNKIDIFYELDHPTNLDTISDIADFILFHTALAAPLATSGLTLCC